MVLAAHSGSLFPENYIQTNTDITGGSDLTLHEVNAAAEIIYEVVDPNANIIFGAVIDDRLQGEVRITVIATGFTGEMQAAPPPSAKAAGKTPQPATPPPSATNYEPKEKTGLDIPDFLQRRRPSN